MGQSSLSVGIVRHLVDQAMRGSHICLFNKQGGEVSDVLEEWLNLVFRHTEPCEVNFLLAEVDDSTPVVFEAFIP